MIQTNLKIITPDGVIIDEMVDIVTIKTISGYIGLLGDHVPFVSTIIPSVLTYRVSGTLKELNISGGIVQANQKFVKIISDSVEKIK